jgi:hypothetical protein
MFRDRINFLSPAIDLTLMQRAEEIYRIQYAASKFLEKKEWIITGKTSIDIDDKEDAISKIMKVFKNTVRRNTILKEVPDNLIGVSTNLSFYNLKFSDDSLIIRYLIGDKSEVSKYNEVLIYNYKLLINTLVLTDFKDFIKGMARLLNATIIWVSDQELVGELQEKLGPSVAVQITDNNH